MPDARRVATVVFLAGLGFTGAATLHCVPAPAQLLPHWTDAVRRLVLPNGLTLLLLPRGDTPIVAVQALYRIGSRNEAAGRSGVAHFVEHMAFRSTEGIAKDDLTNQILRWGGSWNGYTSYDHTTYASAVPSQHVDWVIALERERMSRVTFSEDESAGSHSPATRTDRRSWVPSTT
jgi:zinc protease